MMVIKSGGQQSQHGVVNSRIHDQSIEKAKCFECLGSNITEDGRSLIDVKSGMALAKEAFNKRKVLLKRIKHTIEKENGGGTNLDRCIVFQHL